MTERNIKSGFGDTEDFILITTRSYKGVPEFVSRPVKIIEVDECIDPEGKVLHTPTESHINTVLRAVFASGKKVVVIAFANALKNPLHEKIFRNLLIVAGYKKVFVSHEDAI